MWKQSSSNEQLQVYARRWAEAWGVQRAYMKGSSEQEMGAWRGQSGTTTQQQGEGGGHMADMLGKAGGVMVVVQERRLHGTRALGRRRVGEGQLGEGAEYAWRLPASLCIAPSPFPRLPASSCPQQGLDRQVFIPIGRLERRQGLLSAETHLHHLHHLGLEAHHLLLQEQGREQGSHMRM